MSLYINLLHEEQSKIVERKRDPLKIGILSLLVVALCFCVYYLIRSADSNKLATEKNQLAAEYAKIYPQVESAKSAETNSNLAITSTEAMEKIINGRFYWGPLFSEIIAGTGAEIQITGFEGTLRSADSVTFNLIGMSAGREPRAVAERFRQSMEDRLHKTYGLVSSQFVSLENTDTPLVISGKSFATANFSIAYQITLQNK
jgi:uncharacterized protein YoaH (UPF0181 family)